MRLSPTVFLRSVLFLWLPVVGGSVMAQQVTLQARGITYHEVFGEINRQTGYTVFYSNDVFDDTQRTDVAFKQTALDAVLKKLFAGTRISWKENGKYIVLQPNDHLDHVFGGEAGMGSAGDSITVIGSVRHASDGSALPGVSVRLSGSSQGGIETDLDGRFAINVPAQGKLVFTHVGFKRKVIPIDGRSTLHIALAQADSLIEEVVVTALGIEQSKRALTYSTQIVEGIEIIDSREPNIGNALQGKFSGVHITNTSGSVSSSARIQIRGANSLTGLNQPLFVIDGIPFKNTNASWIGYGGADYGNEIADIDLNNIASVTVLKGANAAALYGSRAANGVILITTKSAPQAAGWGVAYTTNTTVQVPTYFPAYQNEYGQGSNGSYRYVDGVGGGVYDDFGGSWGPRLDGRLIDQWFGKQAPWVPVPDNVRSFFQLGLIAGNELSLTRKADAIDFRFSYNDNRQRGTLPFTNEKKNTASFNAGVRINRSLHAQLIANYVKLGNDNIPSGGYSERNIMSQVIFGGRQLDYSRMRDFETSLGEPINQYSRFSNNPYWLYKYNTNSRERNRVFGTFKLTYDINSWLRMQTRASLDTYWENRMEVTNGYAYQSVIAGSGGAFNLVEIGHQELNLETIFSIERKIFRNVVLNADIGANLMQQAGKTLRINAPELVALNVFNASNVRGTPVVNNRYTNAQIQSLYGQLLLAYNDWIYLHTTLRNDWSSTLAPGKVAYRYPSAGISFIPSVWLQKADWLDFVKFRVNWAQVGSAPAPYQMSATYSAEPSWNDVPMYRYANTFPPSHLKPEITTSKEFGINARFFRNRIDVDLTYYHANSRNQILTLQVPYSSGYAGQMVNAGDIRNRGVEVALVGVPLQRPGIDWRLGMNWSANHSRILSLADGISLYQIGGIWGVNSYARENGAYGDILGSAFLRNARGEVVVDSDGFPVKDLERKVLGNIMPDWLANLYSSLSYRQWHFKVLFDMRKGSAIYSLGHRYGTFSGVLAETAAGGIRESGVVFPGVTEAGNPNTKAVDAQSFYSTANVTGINEFSTFDGSYIKLREISINYTVPDHLVARIGFIRAMTIGLSGRNLAILHSNMPDGFDPEVTAGGTDSGLGFEYGYIPTNRNINVKLQLAF